MRLILAACLLIALSAKAALPDPGAQAAEYYFSHYDYPQAFNLWSSVYQRQPENLVALFRLSELRLMFDGRPTVTKGILDYLTLHASALSRESRHLLRDKLADLQSAFLTDDGQSLFLQGLARARRGDCPTALSFFSQSDALEKGNLRVLREKAACERKTGAHDRNYATLKAAYELQPFDTEVLDGLSEAFSFYGENQKVLALFSSDSEAPRTRRQKLAQAIALLRSGVTAPALLQLQTLSEEKGATPAIVSFELGKANAARADRKGQALENLKAFLSQMKVADPAEWDPYHARERVAEAETLLAGLKAR